MRFFPQTVYCWGSQCFLSVSALTGMLCLPRWACLGSCLPPHLPSGLGCCVRLAGLVFVLSPVLSPVLSAILARWAVSGLVSQLVSHLVWDALSPPWSCLSLVYGLVSQLLSLFCLVACLSSGMLCLPPPWACLFLVPGLVSQLVSHLVWDAVFAFLARLPAQLVSGLFVPSCFPAGLVCPCSGLVSKISGAICATVWGLRWCNYALCKSAQNTTVYWPSLENTDICSDLCNLHATQNMS